MPRDEMPLAFYGGMSMWHFTRNILSVTFCPVAFFPVASYHARAAHIRRFSLLLLL